MGGVAWELVGPFDKPLAKEVGLPILGIGGHSSESDVLSGRAGLVVHDEIDQVGILVSLPERVDE